MMEPAQAAVEWYGDVEGILLLLQKTGEMVYEKEGFYCLGCLG